MLPFDKLVSTHRLGIRTAPRSQNKFRTWHAADSLPDFARVSRRHKKDLDAVVSFPTCCSLPKAFYKGEAGTNQSVVGQVMDAIRGH